MRKTLDLLTLTLFLLAGILPNVVQAQFTLSAEVRPRTEFRNGFKTPTTAANDPAFFTEQRSRIYFDFVDKKYKFRVAFQDVRIWGENSQIFKQEDGNTFLSEAWGQYFFNPKFSLKMGRQIISYDNQRILGGLEWAQQGRRHDAFVLLFEDAEKKSKLHVGLAMNNDDDVPEPAFLQSPTANIYSVAGNYKSMQYAWFNQGFKKGSVSLLALNNTFQNLADTSTYAKQTLGGIASYKLGAITLGADAYYQMGKVGNADLSAVLAGANITFQTKLTPLKFGVEYISGMDDDASTENKITNFSPDFGTNHAHNGLMDYFFVGPANGNVGVTDFYLKTKLKLKKGSMVVNFHEFLTGSTQLDESGAELSKAMGTEIDLVYILKIADNATFHLGYSHLFATETMTTLRPGDVKNNQWAWMMFTFKPTLFKSKEEK